MIVFLGVAVAMFITDVCWAKYIRHAAQGHAEWASVWSAGVTLCGAVSVFAYMHDPIYLLASVLGGVAGTYFTVRRPQRLGGVK
jgi:hypothetical protein